MAHAHRFAPRMRARRASTLANDAFERVAATLRALNVDLPLHMREAVDVIAAAPGVKEHDDARDAHPFVVPIAQSDDGHTLGVYVGAHVARGARDGVGFGFFSAGRADASARDGATVSETTPATSLMRAPIVRCGVRGLDLLASNATMFVRRRLAEDEDRFGLGGGAASRAAGVGALDAYAPGEFQSSPFKHRMEVFLTKNVGRFMDVDEALIAWHVDKKDETSALVTAEWYADGPYGGWARPYAVNAQTLMMHGRAIEARDQARVALSAGPWWTMGADEALLDSMKTLSGYAGQSAADVRRTLDGGDVPVGGASGNVDNGEPAPTKEQLAVKRAMAVLDAVAWGEGEGWTGSRETVAECLDEAGLRDMSEFVLDGLRASTAS